MGDVDVLDGLDAFAESGRGYESPVVRVLRVPVRVQQWQQGMLFLFFGQAAEGGAEAGEPVAVVVDALDGVAGVDEPVDEVVQRDAVGMWVYRIVGLKSFRRRNCAAECGNG